MKKFKNIKAYSAIAGTISSFFVILVLVLCIELLTYPMQSLQMENISEQMVLNLPKDNSMIIPQAQKDELDAMLDSHGFNKDAATILMSPNADPNFKKIKISVPVKKTALSFNILGFFGLPIANEYIVINKSIPIE